MAEIKMGSRDNSLMEIPVLREITKIDTVADLTRLSNFVFSTIPHAQDNGIDLKYNVSEMYWQFINKKRFGWCYWHAMFMHLLLKEYGRESFLYDYGLSTEQLTHSVVVATLRDERFLIDPYFNRYYANEKGDKPLTFHDLLIEAARESDKITTVYGKSKKLVKQGDEYVEMTGQEFEKSVMDSWKVNQNYDKVMMEKCKSKNPLLLIPKKIQKVKILQKLNGNKYYEFF